MSDGLVRALPLKKHRTKGRYEQRDSLTRANLHGQFDLDAHARCRAINDVFWMFARIGMTCGLGSDPGVRQ